MKRTAICLFLIIALSVCACASGGLEGYWPLDEGAGRTAHDLSPARTDGSICGADWAMGGGRCALEFGGRGQFVDIPTRENLQLRDGFTISAWIYPFSVTEGNIVDGKSRYSGYALTLNEGRLQLLARTELVPRLPGGPPSTGDFVFISGEPVVEPNRWSYVACIYDSAHDNIGFYCNGKKASGAVGVHTRYFSPPPTGPKQTRGRISYEPYLPLTRISIGCSGMFPALYDQYKGLIRDVKIFSRVLSDGEIAGEYAQVAPTIAGVRMETAEDRAAGNLSAVLSAQVADAATGKPLEATVQVSGNGRYFVSKENICWGDSNSEKVSGFVTSGTFAVNVPPGKVHIEVTRGLEYIPWVQDVGVKDGEEKRLNIKLERLVDMPSTGWWCGEHHAHSWGHGKGENYEKFTSPGGWKFYADAKKADGFNYVSHPSPHDGGDYKATWTDTFICYPTNEDQVCNIYTGQGGQRDLPARLESLAKTGGTGLVQSVGGDGLTLGQVAVAMALGKVDAWQADEIQWFRYLNMGFKSCLGEGSDYYFTYGFTRFMAREYCRMDRLAWPGMVEAYKRHASFITGGPLVDFKVGGKEIGDTVTIPIEQSVDVSIRAWDIHGLSRIELIRNGSVEKVFSYDGKPRAVTESFSLPVDKSCWCLLKLYDTAGRKAVTSPVYIQLGDKGMQPDSGDVQWALDSIREFKGFLATNPQGHDREKELADALKAEEIIKSLQASPRIWKD